VYNATLSKNKFLLLTTNINREYMYWADKGKIFRILKTLYESLFLAPLIILIARFCNLNTHLLLVEFPPKKSNHKTLLSEKKHSIPFFMHHLIITI